MAVMRRFRSYLFYLFSWLNTITSSLLLLILMVFLSPESRFALEKGWARRNQLLLKYICKQEVEISGLERLPDPPYIIASKHQSYWEALVYPQISPSFMWVMKISLTKFPIVGLALHALGVIGLKRENSVDSMKFLLEKSDEHLKNRFNIVIFPEGTRIAPGNSGRFRSGAAQIAVENMMIEIEKKNLAQE